MHETSDTRNTLQKLNRDQVRAASSSLSLTFKRIGQPGTHQPDSDQWVTGSRREPRIHGAMRVNWNNDPQKELENGPQNELG